MKLSWIHKYIFIILTVLPLVACSRTTAPWENKNAQKICAERGGLYSLHTYEFFFFKEATLICVDGFKVTEFQENK